MYGELADKQKYLAVGATHKKGSTLTFIVFIQNVILTGPLLSDLHTLSLIV